jgi:tetratricopeptide (TPR) repeat protein
MSQVTNEKSVRTKLPVVDKEVETTYGERLLESLKPHANLLMLGIAALFLLFIAIAWIFQSRARVAEGEWLALNYAFAAANATGNANAIKEIADEYPDGIAGLWGLQVAGDYELRQGLNKLAVERAEGIRDLEKARNTLKKVVDAPASRKSTLLQVRSTFSLAYAYESLGEFENARKLYQQLVDQAPNSAFGRAAQRGLNRCTDPSFATIYDHFKDWQDPFAIAPGDPTTEKPDISFPDLPENAEENQAEGSNSESSRESESDGDNTDPETSENTDGSGENSSANEENR